MPRPTPSPSPQPAVAAEVNESNEPVLAYVGGGSYVLVEPGDPIPNAQPTTADATTKEV